MNLLLSISFSLIIFAVLCEFVRGCCRVVYDGSYGHVGFMYFWKGVKNGRCRIRACVFERVFVSRGGMISVAVSSAVFISC
uniref:Secreted protein n=1 Tax=Panstrongylus lignarius TaxID=156445 RepID=A0A224Y3A2_9HEMI